MTMLIVMTSHFWQVVAKSEGIYNFRTFITGIRGALHEAMVSITKSQGTASRFSRLVLHSISTYSITKDTVTN